MCHNLDWFDTYESFNGGSVLIGNDAPSKAVGIWAIKIKMAEGVVRTFGGVRHVLTLKKNLIFLGTLEPKMCSFIAKDVWQGVLVLIKCTKVGNNLYKLMGDTVVGGATVSTKDKTSEDEPQL